MPRRSLFPGGVGNTRGDADNFRTLLDDVETKLFGTLPDETWFYPGHGSDSTLGAERPHPGRVARARLVTTAARLTSLRVDPHCYVPF